jgi:hypothetical protein
LALAPVQPIPNQIALAPERVISTLAVELAASTIDPITPWVQTFETAAANIETLVQFYLQKPFPLLQAVVANLGTYAAELENGQGDLIPEQIWGNIQTFFQAPWDPGTQATLEGPQGELVVPVGQYLSKTEPVQQGQSQPLPPFEGNIFLLQAAASAVLNPSSPTNPLSLEFFEGFAPVWNFLNTPYSGQLVALVGTLISPIVQLTKSFTAIGEFFQAGDVIGAINELINIPANMTNAFLNGAGFLDLTGIAGSIFGDLPEGTTLGIRLGGLLNAMPQDGSLNDPDNPPTTWSGGTGFDGVALSLATPPGLPSVEGIPNGLLGANIGLGQFLADKLLITPPPPPGAQTAAAAPVETPAVEVVADTPAPAPAEAPAPVEAPAPAEAPAEDVVAVVEEAPAAVVDDPAPAVENVAEIEAAVEAIEAPEAEPAEAPAPVDEGSDPEAAAGADEQSDGDTGRAARSTQRGDN